MPERGDTEGLRASTSATIPPMPTGPSRRVMPPSVPFGKFAFHSRAAARSVTKKLPARDTRGGARWSFTALAVLSLWAVGCAAPSEEGPAAVQKSEAVPGEGEKAKTTSPIPPPREIRQADVPLPMKPCFTCHRPIVESYLAHGMANSLGPVGAPPTGVVSNSMNGNRYELRQKDGKGWLEATTKSGGKRRQRVVGRIGAGILDTSWATAEVDSWSGAETGRLFFAPVETITGQGAKLSPFENYSTSPGVDMELTHDCLTCHTLDRLEDLPGAARDPGGNALYPHNGLGADAFEQLSPFACDACHGATERHVELMTGTGAADPADIGLPRLARLPAPQQRDICARCHLQGDARLELNRDPPARGLPSVVHWPVLVPENQEEEYRFVSQLERLVVSECFQASEGMTCSTCHEAHSGVRSQGVASFDAACQQCHESSCSRPPSLTVREVVGEAARTEAGCVDCHVRRSQPFDLPHVRSADHWIRRRISPPDDQVPHRQFALAEGGLQIFDDGRLAAAFETPQGRRWREGVFAVGLATLGRLPEAIDLFDRFPAPGTEAARRPGAPEGWAAIEASTTFHQVRALVLQSQGRLPEALAAYSDALQLNENEAGARMARARLRFQMGDFLGAVEDTQVIIDTHPESEQPWLLRAQLARRLGRGDMATTAFSKATERWPSDPRIWFELAQGLRAQGRLPEAGDALLRAQALNPELPNFP